LPLPLGHAAIGIAVNELCSKDKSALNRWKTAVFVAVLANLPDIDVVIGLLFQGNGNAFHRGPTHSLLFAFLIGLLASNAWKLCLQIPKISFRNCFLLILSHVLADFFFTSSPVSFLWPLEVNWTAGYSRWGDVMNSVFLQPFHDAGIIMGCAVVIILIRVMRGGSYQLRATMRKYKIVAS
jgi:membrane-bound metal-dependent hydrolase YbcI (DUF457 family)